MHFRNIFVSRLFKQSEESLSSFLSVIKYHKVVGTHSYDSRREPPARKTSFMFKNTTLSANTGENCWKFTSFLTNTDVNNSDNITCNGIAMCMIKYVFYKVLIKINSIETPLGNNFPIQPSEVWNILEVVILQAELILQTRREALFSWKVLYYII